MLQIEQSETESLQLNAGSNKEMQNSHKEMQNNCNEMQNIQEKTRTHKQMTSSCDKLCSVQCKTLVKSCALATRQLSLSLKVKSLTSDGDSLHIHTPGDQLFQILHVQPGLISASTITLSCSSSVAVSQDCMDSLMVIWQKYCQGNSSVSGGTSLVEEADLYSKMVHHSYTGSSTQIILLKFLNENHHFRLLKLHSSLDKSLFSSRALDFQLQINMNMFLSELSG